MSSFIMITSKHTQKRPLEKPRRGWEENMQMVLKWIEVNTGNWIDLVRDRDFWRAITNGNKTALPRNHGTVLLLRLNIFEKIILSLIFRVKSNKNIEGI